MGRIDLTGNKFGVQLVDIHMTDFEGDRPIRCNVAFCVSRYAYGGEEGDPIALTHIRDLPVEEDLNKTVAMAKQEMALRLDTLKESIVRRQPLQVTA